VKWLEHNGDDLGDKGRAAAIHLTCQGVLYKGSAKLLNDIKLLVRIDVHGLPKIQQDAHLHCCLGDEGRKQVSSHARVLAVETTAVSQDSEIVSLTLVPTYEGETSWTILCAALNADVPVLLAFKAGPHAVISRLLGLRVYQVHDNYSAATLLKSEANVIALIGPTVTPEEIKALLQESILPARAKGATIVLYRDRAISEYQELIDDDLIFYLAHVSISDDNLVSTIRAAARRLHNKHQAAPPIFSQEEDEQLSEMCLTLLRRESWRDHAHAVGSIVGAILGNASGQCVFYNPATDTLFTDLPDRTSPEQISAAAGLVGYVARTHEELSLLSIIQDPRFDRESDNPESPEDVRFLGRAIVGSWGEVLGVLTATRVSRLPPFTGLDGSRLNALAMRIAPILEPLLSAQFSSAHDGPHASLDPELFRTEALEAYEQLQNSGNLLVTVPAWLRWSHALILLFLITGALYVSFARVSEIVSGPAVIMVNSKTAVTAQTDGVVERLFVSPGTRVGDGELLARLRATSGDSLLARMREEIRAPVDGVINDVAIRAGQPVSAGEQILSLSDVSATDQVIALLPGSYAPQIRAGMPLVLRVDGYPQSREVVDITGVSPDLVGPSDAARYVGRRVADTLALNGSILIVRTSLKKRTFESGGELLPYQDGMVAHADVSVQREPLILALMPGLKQLYGERHVSLGRAAW